MPADDRTFITMHDGVHDHPKVVGLSDAAFRWWHELICWCSKNRTDGLVPRAQWMKARPKVRRELLEAVPGYEPLIADLGDRGVEVHDYLEHQRSAVQIASVSEQKRRAGAKGNHRKYHVGPAGTPSSSCPECVAEGLADVSHVREQVRSQNGRRPLAPALANGSRNGRTRLADPEESLRDSQTDPETDLPGDRSGGDGPESNASATATPPNDPSEQEKHDVQACGDRHDPATSCWRCGAARKAADQASSNADAEAAAERAARRAAIDGCRACDPQGWLEHPETGHRLVRCDHETDPRTQIAEHLGLTP